MVWDRYLPNRLKGATCKTCGKGARCQVTQQNAVPGNWQGFLQSDENKSELFLVEELSHMNVAETLIISLYVENVLSSAPGNTMGLTQGNHEEAATRLLLHVPHSAMSGHRSVQIRSVDTDIVMLAVAHFHILNIEELLLAFGVGKHFRHIPAQQITNTLGIYKCEGLPFFIV